MDKRQIGLRIFSIRKEKGITQEQLAEKTGLRQTHISRIERGVYMPRIDIAERIAEALGCRIGDLIK